MDNSALKRQQIIADLMEIGQENIADAAMDHWDKLADEIILIIGEAGFTSLYERSLHVCQSTFPWLMPLPARGKERFVKLGECLENQTPHDACAAHGHLLTLFTEILASLIGEQLTLNILNTAWVRSASATASKEFDNE
ncbi:MAG: hypothetical protein LC637_12650 [Xanthomonadaceae bacterium]|nr:hypothetical protein [Xanthomonadaceae bacterium]